MINNPNIIKAVDAYRPKYQAVKKQMAKHEGKKSEPKSVRAVIESLKKNDGNYYDRTLKKSNVDEECMNEYDDIRCIEQRINDLNIQQIKIMDEKKKLNAIKHIKFDNFGSLAGTFYIGGDEDNLEYLFFCEKDAIDIINGADAILFDGSWKSTPMEKIVIGSDRNYVSMQFIVIKQGMINKEIYALKVYQYYSIEINQQNKFIVTVYEV